MDSAKSRYLLAEKLWFEGKYAAAVGEFERVISKDPHSKWGLQALFRSATTQMFFLSQYEEALKKFKVFSETGQDARSVWEAKKQMGEIYFAHLERYEQAASHYRALLISRPDSEDSPEFMFRIGRSYFFLWKFKEAIHTYQEIIDKFPDSNWAEKAWLEMGITYFTQGGRQNSQGSEAYQEAIDIYEKFLRRYPKSQWVPQAKFGIAACLEEMDQLDAAYYRYRDLVSSYPSPEIIQIKLKRISERKQQRNH